MLKLKFIKGLFKKKGKIMNETSGEFVKKNEGKVLTVVGVKLEGCPYYFAADELEAVFEKDNNNVVEETEEDK